MRCAATGMYRSGERVMCSCSTDPPTITSPVAPDRPPSNNGSKTFARHECATVIAAFTSCYVVKAGTSTRRGHVAFIASWVCNCATKRETQGQDKAARGSAECDPPERDLGHGLRARSAGNRDEAARSDDRRHRLALLASVGAALLLPRR